MVQTISITSPVKFYSQNYITPLCTFSGDCENQGALYDNRPEQTAEFVKFDASAPVMWRVEFADKYGVPCTRLVNTVIVQNTTAQSVEILQISPDELVGFPLISLGHFELQKNNIFTVAPCEAKGLVFRFYCREESFTVGEIRALTFLFDLKATTHTKLVPNTDGGSYTAQDGRFYSWTNYHNPGLEIEVENGHYDQYQTLRSRVAANENITVIPFKELDWWVLEGVLDREISPSVNRFSGLLNYTIKVVSI